MATLTGILKDSYGSERAGIVTLYPLDTPQFSGDDVIASPYAAVTVDTDGVISIEDVEPGYYRVDVEIGSLTTRDTFTILVPDDAVEYTFEEVQTNDLPQSDDLCLQP